jgi:hypothetical protein
MPRLPSPPRLREPERVSVEIGEARLLEVVAHHGEIQGIVPGELAEPTETKQQILEAVASELLRERLPPHARPLPEPVLPFCHVPVALRFTPRPGFLPRLPHTHPQTRT